MIDPVTPAIAVALVNKAVDGLSDAGKAAFAALGRLVRRKLADGEESHAALVRAEAHPADQAGRNGLAEVIGGDAPQELRFAHQVKRNLTPDRKVPTSRE